MMETSCAIMLLVTKHDDGNFMCHNIVSDKNNDGNLMCHNVVTKHNDGNLMCHNVVSDKNNDGNLMWHNVVTKHNDGNFMCHNVVSDKTRWQETSCAHNSSNQIRSDVVIMKCCRDAVIPVCFLGVGGSRLRRGASFSSSDSLSSRARADGRDGPASTKLKLYMPLCVP